MARTCKEQSIVQGLLLLQRAPASISLGAPYGGRILLLSNETPLRSNKAVFKSGGMHPWSKIRGKYKRARLKSEARPGNRAGLFIGRTPTVGVPNKYFLGCDYNLCVVQLETSVQLCSTLTSGRCNGIHV